MTSLVFILVTVVRCRYLDFRKCIFLEGKLIHKYDQCYIIVYRCINILFILFVVIKIWRTIHCSLILVRGQSKNQFMFYYYTWRIKIDYGDCINMLFLVGHTKNNFDSYFGLFKRQLKNRDDICPSQMMCTINDCAVNIDEICSSDIRWVDWKSFLFLKKTPSQFRITKYKLFKFDKDYPAVLQVN